MRDYAQHTRHRLNRDRRDRQARWRSGHTVTRVRTDGQVAIRLANGNNITVELYDLKKGN